MTDFVTSQIAGVTNYFGGDVNYGVSITLTSTDTLTVHAGATTTGLTDSGGAIIVGSGGTLTGRQISSATVSAGGTELVSVAEQATGNIIDSGGLLIVSRGAGPVTATISGGTVISL